MDQSVVEALNTCLLSIGISCCQCICGVKIDVTVAPVAATYAARRIPHANNIGMADVASAWLRASAGFADVAGAVSLHTLVNDISKHINETS